MANHPVVITSTAAQASGSVIERVGLTGDLSADLASGVITFTDADLTDTHKVVSVVPQGAGYVGGLTLGAIADSTGGVTGSIPWTFSVPDSALDFLAAGQTLVQSYAVTIGDFHNGPATQIVTVTLTGSNDPTVIDAATTTASGSVIEQAAVTGGVAADSVAGKISFTDADLTDTHKVVSVVSQGPGYLGTLTLGAIADSTGGVTGSIPWTFSVPDNALDFLAAGQTLVQKYTVTIGDFHNGPASQVLTVTLTGTNDLPVVTSTVAAATGSVAELAGATGSAALDAASGTITFKDVDLTDTHTASFASQGAGYLGSFTLGALTDSTNGATGSVGWNFSVADGALDLLATGQTLVQKYNVTVADTHGGSAAQVVTVTLTGSNDPTVVVAAATTASGSVTEQTGATGSTVTDLATGTIAFKDADLTDTHKIVSVVPQGTGYLGSFTLGTLVDSTGGATGLVPWNFSVRDGALDFLGAGQTLTQSYAVTIGDFHNGPATQIVTVTLTGTNDPTVIRAAGTVANGAITEHAGQTGSLALDTTTGVISFTDADLIDKHLVASVVPQGAGYIGALTFGAVSDSTGGGRFPRWAGDAGRDGDADGGERSDGNRRRADDGERDDFRADDDYGQRGRGCNMGKHFIHGCRPGRHAYGECCSAGCRLSRQLHSRHGIRQHWQCGRFGELEFLGARWRAGFPGGRPDPGPEVQCDCRRRARRRGGAGRDADAHGHQRCADDHLDRRSGDRFGDRARRRDRKRRHGSCDRDSHLYGRRPHRHAHRDRGCARHRVRRQFHAWHGIRQHRRGDRFGGLDLFGGRWRT